MAQITLPLESTIHLAKDGTMCIEHTKIVTGEVGQELSEAYVELMGGSVADMVRDLDAAAKEAG